MKREYSGTIFEKIAGIWKKSVEKEIEKTGLTEEESRLIEEIFPFSLHFFFYQSYFIVYSLLISHINECN